MTAILCFCGVLGTFFFFQGLAYLFDRICRKLPGKKLWTFTCRQLQEAVFLKSSSLAISSLLILFAIICCSYGVGMSGQLGQQDTAGIDFTFDEKKETLEEVLSSQKVDQYFPICLKYEMDYFGQIWILRKVWRSEKYMHMTVRNYMSV